MMMKIIEILVSPKGETKVQTRGFAGPSCREASRFLEDALGQRLAEQTTAEYHQQQHTGQKQHNRQQQQ